MNSGWQTKTLGEVCRIRTGKKDVNQGNPGGAYPFFTCAAEHTFSDSYSFDTEALLVAGNGNVGQVSYYNGKFEAYQRTYVISDFSDVQARYLFLVLDGKLKETVSKQKLGNTMPYIKVGMLTDFQVPIPPVSEQNRIVAILDEAFEGIATAKANAEKNLKNARELFESRLEDVFSSTGVDWSEKTLGEACSIARGGSPRPIKEFLTTEADGVNWVKISDATSSAKFILSTAEKIKPAGVSRSRLVRDGDFLLSNSMSFGRPYIMRTTGCIHDGWLVLSEYQGSFDQDFLYLLLGSQFVYRQFDRLAAGSTVRNLNIDLASSVRVPVPPLQQQVQMASELGELSEVIDQLAEISKRKLAALDELKKSLLHQAFSGKL